MARVHKLILTSAAVGAMAACAAVAGAAVADADVAGAAVADADVAGAAVADPAVGGAAVARATTSHAVFWTNKPGTANCGVRVSHKPVQLLCSAKGIPRPKHGGTVGDPFVVLGQTGRPQLVLISQDEFPPGTPQKLANGTTWSRNGVTCAVSGKVKCTNNAGHGFTIGNGKYAAF